MVLIANISVNVAIVNVTVHVVSAYHSCQHRWVSYMIRTHEYHAPLSQEVWERTPAEAQASIRTLEARGAALEATVQRLLARLRMDSRHASQPPSRDPPATRRPPQRHTPSGRKPGGHPGHHGQHRGLVALEDVAAVLPGKPPHGARCPHPLHGEEGPPQRHQVTALPPVKPMVTASQVPRLVCPACGATTSRPPRWCADGRLWATCASHRGPVHGSVSCVEAHDPGRPGRPGRGAAESGDHHSSGAGHRTCGGLLQSRAPGLMGARNLSRIAMKRGGATGTPVRGCGAQSPSGAPSLWSACRAGPRWCRACWGNSAVGHWRWLAGVPTPGPPPLTRGGFVKSR
jgi:hypothetical protein